MSPPVEQTQESAPPPLTDAPKAGTEAKELETATDKEVSKAPQTAFGEDLPPDFWDNEPLDAEVFTEQDASSGPPQTDAITNTAEDGEELEHDPRFKTMQSLFPGRIVQWQKTKAKAASEATEEGDENAVDLEAEDSDEAT